VTWLAGAGLGALLLGVALSLERDTRAAGLILLGLGLATAFMTLGSAPPVNPAALAAYRDIETRCALEPAGRGCAEVTELRHRCAHDPCSASDYHQALTRSGFDLPPLHRR
jgi:hypothetical protein